MTFSPGPASFIRGPKSASPSNTRGGSRVPEWGPLGSVRGALSNERPYRDLRNVVPKYPLTSRADSRDPAEFWPQRLFAFELRRGDTQLGPMLGSQQGEHCPPAPPKSIKRQATAGVTWRRFVPGRWLPDRATPLPPPSIGPLPTGTNWRPGAL